jgi:hypothetical protein
VDAGIQFVSTREIAKTIKNILRQKFPNTKFSVRSSREHNAIIVDWFEGPATNKIKKVCERYQGMRRSRKHPLGVHYPTLVSQPDGAVSEVYFRLAFPLFYRRYSLKNFKAVAEKVCKHNNRKCPRISELSKGNPIVRWDEDRQREDSEEFAWELPFDVKLQNLIECALDDMDL